VSGWECGRCFGGCEASLLSASNSLMRQKAIRLDDDDEDDDEHEPGGWEQAPR